MAPPKKKTDLGAGLRVSKNNIDNHPAGPPKHGELSQAERAFTLASTFMSGVLAISASQFIGAPLKLIDPQFYEGYMAYTKESFAVLITCLTQWWAPTVVRVSGDESMRGQLIQKKDGSLQCNFADRMVLMANHQLYTDWLYLWWIAYTNGMHGYIYIILKESLKNIPIIGWGAQFYNFIFLARNWETDQARFKSHLQQLSNPKDPMWLIIFPEGTNLSATTKEKSKKWAEKNGLKDMKHQLLPRSTGIRFCLQQLRESTEWLYDCTIGYEGVPQGQFGQDIFTLRSSFFEGRPPKSVNMHWRRFRIDDIPIQNQKAFEVWLRNRWREKDYMLEYFYRNNKFPAEDYWKDQLDLGDNSSESQSIRKVSKAARIIETEIKSGNWNEFVKIFAPISSVMMALMVAYGASPNDLPLPGGAEFLQQHMGQLLQVGDAAMKGKGLPGPEDMDKLIETSAKMAAGQAAKPQSQGKVQKLTQENLAKLVKETAIRNGMVDPRTKMRRASSAIAAPQKKAPARPAPQKAKSTVNPSTAAKKTPAKAATNAQASKPLNGPMQTVMTKSGVAIKVPAKEIKGVMKNEGIIVTKSGVAIKVPMSEIEEAKEKGGAVMIHNGIPIQITPSPSGEKKPANAPAKPASQQKVPTAPSQTKKPTVQQAQKAPSKLSGGTPAKKPPAASGAVKKTAGSTAPKSTGAQPRKLAS